MFGAIFTGVSDIVSGWFSLKKSQLQTQRDIEANKSRLALSTESNNSAWEMADLANSDKWLKRILTALIIWPIIHCNFDAAAVAQYFSALANSIPGWWLSLFILIFSNVFGISPMRNSILSIIAAAKK